MDRYTITVRPGVDFRLAFRVFYEDDEGVQTEVPLDVPTFRLTYGNTVSTLAVEDGFVRIHLNGDETAAITGPATYVVDKINPSGDIERILEGQIHVSDYRSVTR